MPPADTVTVRIEALAAEGDGVGRALEGTDGRPWFVPLSAPGDVASIRPERSAHARRGSVVEILEASPDRVEPPCPHFGVCGGCQWQHLTDSAQRAAKHSTVQVALDRAIESLPEIQAPVPSLAPYAYRHRVTLAARATARGVLLGFREARSKRIVDVRRCPVLSSELEGSIGAIRRSLARWLTVGPITDVPAALDPATGRVLIRLPGSPSVITPRFGAVDGDQVVEIDPEEATGRYEIEGRSIAFLPGVFTQANLEANRALVRHVVDRARAENPKALLDVYSGVGNYSFALAAHVERIRGIEQDVVAVGLAARTARDAGLEDVSFSALEADGALDRIVRRKQPYEAVVCNPPRAGLGDRVSELVAGVGAARIVYVSCSPRTLARDLRVLAGNGYAVARVQPFDLFPQTFHVETVVTLTRA